MAIDGINFGDKVEILAGTLTGEIVEVLNLGPDKEMPGSAWLATVWPESDGQVSPTPYWEDEVILRETAVRPSDEIV